MSGPQICSDFFLQPLTNMVGLPSWPTRYTSCRRIALLGAMVATLLKQQRSAYLCFRWALCGPSSCSKTWSASISWLISSVSQGTLLEHTLLLPLTLMIVGTSLAIGVVLLLAILAKYVSTQAEVSWHVKYADRSMADGTGVVAGWQNDSLATSSSSTGGAPLHQRSIYDSWLVVRFTLAFAGLA